MRKTEPLAFARCGPSCDHPTTFAVAEVPMDDADAWLAEAACGLFDPRRPRGAGWLRDLPPGSVERLSRLSLGVELGANYLRAHATRRSLQAWYEAFARLNAFPRPDEDDQDPGPGGLPEDIPPGEYLRYALGQALRVKLWVVGRRLSYPQAHRIFAYARHYHGGSEGGGQGTGTPLKKMKPEQRQRFIDTQAEHMAMAGIPPEIIGQLEELYKKK